MPSNSNSRVIHNIRCYIKCSKQPSESLFENILPPPQIRGKKQNIPTELSPLNLGTAVWEGNLIKPAKEKMQITLFMDTTCWQTCGVATTEKGTEGKYTHKWKDQSILNREIIFRKKSKLRRLYNKLMTTSYSFKNFSNKFLGFNFETSVVVVTCSNGLHFITF